MSTANNGYVQSKTDIYFQKLFTNSSVAIWDADFTALMADISQFKSDGITDLHLYFKENKCALKVLAESIKTNQANRAALELFKVHSEQEIRPLISASFLSSASLPFINLLSALRNDDEIFETEFEICNNQGGKLNLQISISLEVTEKNAKSILIQFIDISKFQNSYKALKEGETPFQKLADLSEEAIIVNIKGEFIDHNQAAERVFGYSQEEFSKLNAKDLIAPEDYPLALQSLENDSEAPYEIKAIKKNGDRFPILVRKSVV